jgi:hypothetical protein
VHAITINPQIRMPSTQTTTPAVRINPANPDHHLYRNNGTWWIHYTIHCADYTMQRVRESLRTRSRDVARRRRDLYIGGLLGKGRVA